MKKILYIKKSYFVRVKIESKMNSYVSSFLMALAEAVLVPAVLESAVLEPGV